jgi:hypothetical protein
LGHFGNERRPVRLGWDATAGVLERGKFFWGLPAVDFWDWDLLTLAEEAGGGEEWYALGGTPQGKLISP